MKESVFIFAFTLCFLAGFSQKTGTFKDARDKKVYRTVTIGGQTMLAENFAFKPKQGVYWAYDNNAANVKKYGYLYDWETAKKIAPPGWHLPDVKEWEKFQADLDSAAFEKILPGGSSGFNIEFGGGFSIDKVFFGLHTSAYFWLATPVEEGASWGFFVYSDLKMMGLESYHPEQGYSVRLFKNK